MNRISSAFYFFLKNAEFKAVYFKQAYRLQIQPLLSTLKCMQ